MSANPDAHKQDLQRETSIARENRHLRRGARLDQEILQQHRDRIHVLEDVIEMARQEFIACAARERAEDKPGSLGKAARYDEFAKRIYTTWMGGKPDNKKCPHGKASPGECVHCFVEPGK